MFHANSNKRPAFLRSGAPPLDMPPSGLGFRPLLHGHCFPGLGITIARKEADEVQAKLLSISCVFPGPPGREAEGSRTVGAPGWVASVVAQLPLCLVRSAPSEPLHSECDVVMVAPSEVPRLTSRPQKSRGGARAQRLH